MKQRDPDNEVTAYIYRDEFEDETPVHCEIYHYESAGQGGCWDEKLGASVTLGDIWDDDGKQVYLTPGQLQSAEEQVLEHIETRMRENKEEREIMESDL